MPSKDKNGQVPAQPINAGQDAYIAGNDVIINQGGSNTPAGNWNGLGVLAPPFGDLPLELRGRDEVVARLQRLLAEPDDRAHALCGLGGTGKSAVALRIAKVARDQGMSVWWVEASSMATSMMRLARMLGADDGMLTAVQAGEEDPADVLWNRLEARDKWLLVVNNADDVGALAVMGRAVRHGNGWVRGSKSGLMLITTRERNEVTWGHSVELHYVTWLDDASGAAILSDLAPSVGTVEEAAGLSRRLGGLPLALHQAGSYIKHSQDPAIRTFADYQAALATRFPELMDPGNDLDDRELVTRTWELSLAQLAKAGHHDARSLLEVLSWFLGGTPIPTDRLKLGTLCQDHCPGDASALLKAARRLENVGLLETRQAPDGTQNGYWVLHPLVSETIRYQLSGQPGYLTSAGAAVRLLVETVAGLDPAAQGDWPTWHDWLPHASSLVTSAPAAIDDAQLSDLKTVLQEIGHAISLSAGA